MIEPDGLNLDILRARRSVIAGDRVERLELSFWRMRVSTTRSLLKSRKAIKQPWFATRWLRSDARAQRNQRLVFIEV